MSRPPPDNASPRLSSPQRLKFALLSVMALPGLACAQDPNAVLAPVIVEANRAQPSNAPAVGERQALSDSPRALPSAVTTLDADQLQRTNVGRDISNVFRRVPGVLANSIDQGDTANGFRMRGFTTQGTHGADTAVYVDGVPQNIPSGQGGAGHGPVFLEWLTPDMISRIDVVKGPVSVLHGDQNRAGSVDIRTGYGGPNTPSSVALSVERFGLRRASLVLSNRFGEVDSLLVADVLRNDGYRRDGNLDRDNVFWKLSRPLDGGIVSARVSHYEADFSAAGYLSLPDLRRGLDPRSTQFNNPGFGSAKRSSLVINRTPAADGQGWSATAYYERFERSRAISTSATQHNVGIDDRQQFGARLFNSVLMSEQLMLTFGGEVRQDRGDAYRQVAINRIPTANYVNNQRLDLLTYGVFAQAQYRPVEPLKLIGGVRYDRFDYDIENRKLPSASTAYRDGVFTPKLGAVWSVMPTLDLFANVAQGFRSPAAEQISGSGSVGPLGAPGGIVSHVAPSKVRSHDLGFTTAPTQGWTVSGAFYYTLNEDEIVLQPDGSYRSVGDTTRKGYELETRYRIASNASVYASYGRIIEAKVNNPAANAGARLSVPKHQLKAGADYRFRLGDGALTLNADAYLISGNPYYQGAPQTQEAIMPVYTRYDLRATYDWRKTQWTLYAVFQPHQFGSEIAYGASSGLLVSPVPRRSFGATVRYFF